MNEESNESHINKVPENSQNPVTFKPSTMDLRISCLLQTQKKLFSKEGYLEKKSSSFFKGWNVIKFQIKTMIIIRIFS